MYLKQLWSVSQVKSSEEQAAPSASHALLGRCLCASMCYRPALAFLLWGERWRQDEGSGAGIASLYTLFICAFTNGLSATRLKLFCCSLFVPLKWLFKCEPVPGCHTLVEPFLQQEWVWHGQAWAVWCVPTGLGVRQLMCDPCANVIKGSFMFHKTKTLV